MIGPPVSEHTVSSLTGEGPIKSYLIVSIFTAMESDGMKNLEPVCFLVSMIFT